MATNYGKFVGVDTLTGGDWRKRYGQQGQFVLTNPTGSSFVESKVQPANFSTLTHGSAGYWSMASDGTIAGNPTYTVYPDGSAASGSAFRNTTNGGSNYLQWATDAAYTTPFRVAFYICAIDGVARTQQLVLSNGLTTVLDTLTLTIAPYQTYYVQAVFVPNPIRQTALTFSETGGGQAIVNGLFFDTYRPNAIGGFGGLRFGSQAY